MNLVGMIAYGIQIANLIEDHKILGFYGILACIKVFASRVVSIWGKGSSKLVFPTF